MGTHELVSVVIPAYNAGEYLEASLSSALNQTHETLELIVVDDASRDNTTDVALSFNDPRVRTIRNARRLGAGATRNRALQAATGSWVAFLDADDRWRQNRIEKLLEAARKHGADLVADDLAVVTVAEGQATEEFSLLQRRGLSTRTTWTIDAEQYVRYDLGLIMPLVSRQLIVTEALEFPEHVAATEDFVFFLKCIVCARKPVFLPEALYYYRRHTQSLSTDTLRRLADSLSTTTDLLSDESLELSTPVRRLLEQRLRRIEGQIGYQQFKSSIRRGQLLAAARLLASSPALRKYLLQRRLALKLRSSSNRR